MYFYVAGCIAVLNLSKDKLPLQVYTGLDPAHFSSFGKPIAIGSAEHILNFPDVPLGNVIKLRAITT
jgi:hypothetical protein